ncbi:hypothetical protein R70006_05798 [Paraburkholderia domus]|uniref:hypothetical protein n=1 Tax=Paraburkholderia domus TaxID=2793075 RepID=UPI001914125A|nr:hypothetical protein [Paraburkholderia domus]MBK5052538.1 hypothetical protein [Burkholderia sp. R-70006]CAE6811953.1 hypothetical protein R70006_05798 [Paraburkholderia domus]CAE6889082.1 hypothetical protein R75471_02269 [Paraburkholderia domus]
MSVDIPPKHPRRCQTPNPSTDQVLVRALTTMERHKKSLIEFVATIFDRGVFDKVSLASRPPYTAHDEISIRKVTRIHERDVQACAVRTRTVSRNRTAAEPFGARKNQPARRNTAATSNVLCHDAPRALRGIPKWISASTGK